MRSAEEVLRLQVESKAASRILKWTVGAMFATIQKTAYLQHTGFIEMAVCRILQLEYIAFGNILHKNERDVNERQNIRITDPL